MDLSGGDLAIRIWNAPYSIDDVKTIAGKSFRLINLPFIIWVVYRRYFLQFEYNKLTLPHFETKRTHFAPFLKYFHNFVTTNILKIKA